MAKLRYGITLAMSLCTVAIVGTEALTRGSNPPEPDFTSLVKGYTTWTRVNAEPFRMAAAVSVACAAPAGAQASPHSGPAAYIDVYVNQAGRAAMLTPGPVAFPAGSVIVKEKRHVAGASDPELLTVMLKRTRGYNPGTGDWEFAVLDGKAAAVQAQGKLENCMQCHKTIPSSDYVFRPYLPK